VFKIENSAEFYEQHYLKWCKGRQSYYASKKYFLKVLPEWFKIIRLDEIKTKELELVQNHFMELNYSVATCNRYLSIIKASFTKAEEWGIVNEQQLKAIRKVKPLKGEVSRLRFLTEEEIEKLLSNCDKELYPIVVTALNTSMRKGEILNLKWDNIDFKTGFIYLEKTKNIYRRKIPINETLSKMLRQLYAQRRLDNDYVFVNPKTGKRVTEFKRRFIKSLRKAGIRDFRFHDLRHKFRKSAYYERNGFKNISRTIGTQNFDHDS
jgi:integrase